MGERNESKIVEIFENGVKNLIDFYSKNNDPFKKEQDSQAYLFKEIFQVLERENLLFGSQDSKVILNVETSVNFKNLFKEKFENFSDKLDIFSSIIETVDELYDLKDEMEKHKDYSQKFNEFFAVYGKKLTKFKTIDLTIKHPSKMPNNDYLIMAEIKTSSTGYYKTLYMLPSMLEDVIKLNLLKILGECKHAYMIFLDIFPKSKLPLQRKEFFQKVENKFEFKIQDNLKHLFEEIKFYYLYKNRESNTIEEVKPKLIGDNITVFLPENI
jgi:hypothetical protein